jgi:hypothetical protein
MMKVRVLLSAILAACLVHADTRVAKVFIQPIHSTNPTPAPLAEVQYDTALLSESEVISFEAPELPEESKLVRIGIYDPTAAKWISSTSVASVDNFDKGYSPTIMISVDTKGEPISASYRGVRIDAGQTRDFGPQPKIIVTTKGKLPDLNRPVVLNPDGRKPVQEEKTLFQKYVDPKQPPAYRIC